MEQEKVDEVKLMKNNADYTTFGQNLTSVKYIYTPIYLQILLLGINFYTCDIKINI